MAILYGLLIPCGKAAFCSFNGLVSEPTIRDCNKVVEVVKFRDICDNTLAVYVLFKASRCVLKP